MSAQPALHGRPSRSFLPSDRSPCSSAPQRHQSLPCVPLRESRRSLWSEPLLFSGSGIIPDPDYVPTSAKIDAAKIEAPALLEEMNNGSLILDAAKKTVQRVGSAKLDLGGIAKGYAVEKVDKILKDHGIKEYLVNGGTSSLAFGVAEDGGPFRVRLKYTGDDETSLRYYVKKAFTSTSAVYEQYRVVDGVTYSHVINTVTGIPVTDYSMAFLEGEDSTRLDAYSTACMIADVIGMFMEIFGCSPLLNFVTGVFSETFSTRQSVDE